VNGEQSYVLIKAIIPYAGTDHILTCMYSATLARTYHKEGF